jgi:ribose 5-phosphate isomerase B
MVVYFGADHGGFQLKEQLKQFVKDMGYEIFDAGAAALDPGDDYPQFAAAVAAKVAADPQNNRGILLCRNGAGVAIVANKFKGVRATLALSPNHAFSVRNDDDANVLALGGDFTTPEEAQKIARVFLLTPFEPAARRVRRLKEIENIENGKPPL